MLLWPEEVKSYSETSANTGPHYNLYLSGVNLIAKLFMSFLLKLFLAHSLVALVLAFAKEMCCLTIFIFSAANNKRAFFMVTQRQWL